MPNIRKVKLIDGSVYSFFDEGALRLNENNVLITGNSQIDQVILQGNLYITEIDDVPVSQAISNVLVQNETTGEILKRSTDKLLEDIGGASYAMQDATGTLLLKIGKQED